MIAYLANLVAAILSTRCIVLYAFDHHAHFPLEFRQAGEQPAFQDFVEMLVRAGPYFSAFLAANLLLQYLCRLDGSSFNERQKESGLLLHANQVIQNSVESFLTFWCAFLLFALSAQASSREKTVVVSLFLLGRLLFGVLYYVGFLLGVSYLRAVGVGLQVAVVAIMLLRVMAAVDLVALLRV